MRKLIASMNMTLDGFCDHTAGIADDELHEHYSDMLRKAGLLLYGRTTYQLMEDYWPGLVKRPSGNKALDDFAVQIDSVPKIVYSRTLKSVDWETAELKRELVKEEIEQLKQLPGKDIYAGSPSMIVQLTQMGLVDEYHLCIHPVILGSGLTLFKNITSQIDLELLNTKTYGSGVVALYYRKTKR